MTLTLENNKLYQTDQLQFEVACVDSPTGRCPCPCFHKEDPSCACRDLRRSIKVSVTKTPVYAVYPLSQPRMFNGRPYEVRHQPLSRPDAVVCNPFTAAFLLGAGIHHHRGGGQRRWKLHG